MMTQGEQRIEIGFVGSPFPYRFTCASFSFPSASFASHIKHLGKSQIFRFERATPRECVREALECSMGKLPGPWTTDTIILCTLLHLGLTFPVVIFSFNVGDMFPHYAGFMPWNDLTIFWITNSKPSEVCWQPLPGGTRESSVVAPQGSENSGLCWRDWVWMGSGLLLVQLRALSASSRQLEPNPRACEAAIHVTNPGK